VVEIKSGFSSNLSNATYVKFCVKQRGPPRKTKYYTATDSEQVPRGKGEKKCCEHSEIDPETMCQQGVIAILWWLRAFCIMSLRVTKFSKFKRL